MKADENRKHTKLDNEAFILYVLILSYLVNFIACFFVKFKKQFSLTWEVNLKIKGTCGGQNKRYLWWSRAPHQLCSPSLLFVGSDIKLFIKLICKRRGRTGGLQIERPESEPCVGHCVVFMGKTLYSCCDFINPYTLYHTRVLSIRPDTFQSIGRYSVVNCQVYFGSF